MPDSHPALGPQVPKFRPRIAAEFGADIFEIPGLELGHAARDHLFIDGNNCCLTGHPLELPPTRGRFTVFIHFPLSISIKRLQIILGHENRVLDFILQIDFLLQVPKFDPEHFPVKEIFTFP